MTVGSVGWVGLKEDVQRAASDSADTFCFYVVDGSMLSLGQGRGDASVLVSYYPSTFGLEEPNAMGLGLAEIDASIQPKLVRTAMVDAGLQDETSGRFPWTGACFEQNGGRPVLWYYPPRARALVRYDILGGTRTSFGAPLELGGLTDIAIAAGPASACVYFGAEVIAEDGRLRSMWGSFDSAEGRWQTKEAPLRSKFLLAADRKCVHMLRTDKEAMTLYGLHDEGLGSPKPPSHRWLPSEKWSAATISPVGYQAAECAIIARSQGPPAVVIGYLLSSRLFEIALLSGRNDAWTKGVVGTGRFSYEPFGGLSFLLAPSGAEDASGTIHITYYDPGTLELKHAWQEGEVWRTETVAPLELAGRTATMVVRDKLVIVYFAPRQLELRLAWRQLTTAKTE